jgi:hypothetical protein
MGHFDPVEFSAVLRSKAFASGMISASPKLRSAI